MKPAEQQQAFIVRQYFAIGGSQQNGAQFWRGDDPASPQMAQWVWQSRKGGSPEILRFDYLAFETSGPLLPLFLCNLKEYGPSTDRPQGEGQVRCAADCFAISAATQKPIGNASLQKPFQILT